MRVANICEKNVRALPTPPVVVPTNASTDVLPTMTTTRGEIMGRYIQNVGGNDCYYAIGADCNPAYYNGILQSNGKQQLDVSNTCQRISVYSVGGTTIAVTVLRRVDNDTFSTTI